MSNKTSIDLAALAYRLKYSVDMVDCIRDAILYSPSSSSCYKDALYGACQDLYEVQKTLSRAADNGFELVKNEEQIKVINHRIEDLEREEHHA